MLKRPLRLRQRLNPSGGGVVWHKRIAQIPQKDERHLARILQRHRAGQARPWIRAGILADGGDALTAPHPIQSRHIRPIAPAKEVNLARVHQARGDGFIEKMVNGKGIEVVGGVAIPLIPMPAGAGLEGGGRPWRGFAPLWRKDDKALCGRVVGEGEGVAQLEQAPPQEIQTHGSGERAMQVDKQRPFFARESAAVPLSLRLLG